MELFTIIITGSPGSGKGTQAKLLETFLKGQDKDRRCVYLSTGERFRELAKGDSYSSDLMREVLERGGLQPEFLPIWVWSGLFVEELKGNEHIIADGFPRMPLERDVFETALNFYHREKSHILNLKLTEEQAIERLGLRKEKEGRADDRLEALNNRFNLYNQKTVPTIEAFRTREKYYFHDIDASLSVDEVSKEIMQALNLETLSSL